MNVPPSAVITAEAPQLLTLRCLDAALRPRGLVGGVGAAAPGAAGAEAKGHPEGEGPVLELVALCQEVRAALGIFVPF